MNQLKTPISNLILGGKRNEKGVYRSKTGHGGHVDLLDRPLDCRQPFISLATDIGIHTMWRHLCLFIQTLYHPKLISGQCVGD